MSEIIGFLIALVGFISVTILTISAASITNGYVLTIIWGWFIVPIFNLPSLSITQAIGTVIVVSFLTKKATKSKKSLSKKKTAEEERLETDEALKNFIIDGFVYPLGILFVSWIVHLFM